MISVNEEAFLKTKSLAFKRRLWTRNATGIVVGMTLFEFFNLFWLKFIFVVSVRIFHRFELSFDQLGLSKIFYY